MAILHDQPKHARIHATDAAPAAEPLLSRRCALVLASGGLATAGSAELLGRPIAALAKKKITRSGAAGGSVEQQIAAAVEAVMRHTGTPGVAVGYVLQGVETFSFHGEARTDTHAPFTSDTICGLGSVTKTVTSTMLASQTLADPTHFTLDDPVTRHLPPQVGRKGRDINKVKLWELASHTASFPHSSSILGAGLFLEAAHARLDRVLGALHGAQGRSARHPLCLL
jgi:CubicO group peptidase (beta-lactamase class C family)